MRRFLSSSLTIFALFLTAQVAQAQFYTQEFNGGMPAGWTTTDANNHNVLWKWCAGPSSTCVQFYTETPGEFASTTASNGFMYVDSDAAGQLSSTHKSRLKSAVINCSAANQVFIVYETYIGVFATPSTGNVKLQVSSDNTNWTDFPVIDGLDQQFSGVQEIIQTDISSVAANKPTVYLRWEWTGNYEYYWFLDDVKLYDADPSPANDLAVGDFFYPPSSFATPESQISTDTFGFYAYVSNKGTAMQTGITLTAEVLDNTNDNVLFTTSTSIASLEPGYVDSFLVLPDQYAPELPIGVYKIVYTVTSAEGDERLNDNKQSDLFVVTAATFSKENSPTTASQPLDGGDYVLANIYTMGTGSLDSYKTAGLQFAAATNPGVSLPGIAVTAYLFKVNDDIEDDWSNFNNAELFSESLEWLGDANFTFPANAVNFDLESVELLDGSSGLPGIALENGKRYFACIGYSGAANNVAFHAADDEISHYYYSSPIFTSAWNLAGFGVDFNPTIRMIIELTTIADKTPLQESVMTVFPNPVKGTLNLNIQFDAPTDATITIAEINGRVIKIDDRKSLSNEVLTYNLPQLAPGTYLARIATAEGTKTKKFVVVK